MAIRLYKFLLFFVIFSSLLTIYMHASHIFTYVHVCLYVCILYIIIFFSSATHFELSCLDSLVGLAMVMVMAATLAPNRVWVRKQHNRHNIYNIEERGLNRISISSKANKIFRGGLKERYTFYCGISAFNGL